MQTHSDPYWIETTHPDPSSASVVGEVREFPPGADLAPLTAVEAWQGLQHALKSLTHSGLRRGIPPG